MFVLVQLQDDVRILPENLDKPRLEAITTEIERCFLDKVVPDLGLVVTLYEVVSVEGGFIYPGDGAPHFTVTFKLVVFRPFPGEVLVGRLVHCDRAGVRVSLGFFDDVLVPRECLQEPSQFDEAEQLWVWQYQGSAMYMDLGHEIRLRVTAVRYPTVPAQADYNRLLAEAHAAAGGAAAGAAGAVGAAGGDGAVEGLGPAAAGAPRPFAPMVVVGDINEDGLGMLSWWAAPEADK